MAMSHGYSVEQGAGGAQAKSGANAMALNRAKGYEYTMMAVHSKTRSHYKGSDKHNHYEGCSGYGGNENIVGYSTGNGGSRMPSGYSKHY